MTLPDQDAPLELTLDRGRLTCRLPDAHGRLWRYEVRPRPDGVDFVHLEREGVPPRRVTRRPGRLADCSCPWWHFQGRARCLDCKHIVGFRRLTEAFALESLTVAAPKKKPDETSPTDRLRMALADPFPPAAVGWKPQTASGARALAVAYIDARDVMDRLDAVVGVGAWKDEYSLLPNGNVTCRLSLLVGGEWVGKEDVGGESEQKDQGDKTKAAFSDALKRAAVKWGVGRYLYSLPLKWVGYDAQKRQLTETPQLPAWALPGGAGRPPGTEQRAHEPEPQPTATVIVGGQHVAGPAPTEAPPADWHRGLMEHDATLVTHGLCKPGELVKHVAAGGKQRGYPADLTHWSAVQVEVAKELVKEFVQSRRAQNPAAKAS